MKKIVLKSKLSEEEALSKFKAISDRLIKEGVLTKGDELVSEIDDVDSENKILITINGDLMDKDKYRKLKPELLSIGELITNDLKNFDETEPENPEGSEEVHDDKEPISKENPKVAEGQNKEEQQDAVHENLVRPAVMTLHDTQSLLFDINEQNNFNTMNEIKDLLFDESELQELNFDSLLFSESECREVTFDELLFDESELEEKPAEDPKPEETKEGEEKLHCNAKTFDDLLFSDEETKVEDPKPEENKDPEPVTTHDENDPKPEEPKPATDPKPTDPNTGEEKKFDGKLELTAMKAIHRAMEELEKTGKPYTPKDVAEKCGCTEEMVKEASRYFDELGITPKPAEAPKTEVKKFKVVGTAGNLIKDGFDTKDAADAYIKDQKLNDVKVEDYVTLHDEIDPEKVEKAKGIIAELKKDGKDVTFEEVAKAADITEKEFDEAMKDAKEDPKPEEKPEPEPELTRDELIKKLNKEHEADTLLGVAKRQKGIIK